MNTDCGYSSNRLPEIDIVIIDYNVGQLVRECLQSLYSHLPQHAKVSQVVIVDNDSSAPTWDYISDIDLPVRYIHNSKNRGFAAACNLGASSSKADYILFLNPDTRLNADSLDVPVYFMEDPTSSSVGIVGIQLLNDSGEVSRTCSVFPEPLHFLSKAFGMDYLFPNQFSSGKMLGWDHMTSQEVDGVMGAFYLIRRDLFRQLGGFDERFFVYYEEADVSYRAALAGYRSFYLVDAQAYHRGQGTSDRVRAKRLFYSLRSRIRYAFKHFDLFSAYFILFLTLFIEPFSRILLDICRLSVGGVKDTVYGYLLLWLNLVETLRPSVPEHSSTGRDI